MATAGILGQLDCAATTNELLYECPASTEAFVAVNIVARSGSKTVRLALAPNTTPADSSWLEYDFPIGAGGTPLLREGIYMKATDRLYVWSSATGVSANAYGKETAA
jgi:hypothetical protein